MLRPNALDRPAPVTEAARAALPVRTGRSASRFPKAADAQGCIRLEQLPNIGPPLAADLRRIGVESPQQLIGRDGFDLYQQLSRATGKRQDPCVLDTFLAIVDFMHGAAAAPWWRYTAERKRRYGPV